MEIEFIGHASFSIQTQGKRIISDPWLDGKVFNDSWALISPPAPVDWSAIDYLWISHEHPDHFHFPTLKSIPAADKQGIVVLYQTHTSSRIVDALHKLGFPQVLELPLYRWKTLAPGIDVYCGSIGSMDSFLAVRSEGKCIVNFNDCMFNPGQLRYIKSALGHIDVLFTQFSIANWVGNDTDEIGGAAEQLEAMQWQSDILKPGHVVPFASFVYFCNEENQRMNAWINTPATIARQNIPGLHFMYPGDRWNLQTDADASLHALVRYTKDFETNKKIDPTPPAVPAEQLLSAARACMDQFVKQYPVARKRIPPLTIHVTDLDKALSFEPATGAVAISDTDPAQPCRMQMCSQAAWYVFKFPWGGGTMEVSGMFRDPQHATEGLHPFFYYQHRLSTRFLEFGNLAAGSRTLAFLWRKKWEIAHRLLHAAISFGRNAGKLAQR